MGVVHTVDLHFAVGDNGLDEALLLEVSKALASQRTVDLHSVDEGGDGDQTVGLDILVELLGCRLVEKDGVLSLVLDLALRPLLLLLLSSSSRRLQIREQNPVSAFRHSLRKIPSPLVQAHDRNIAPLEGRGEGISLGVPF